MALLTGCAQDLIFSDVNRDTVDVLARNGCEVFTPPHAILLRLAARPQRGTGAGAQHGPPAALTNSRPEQFDAIITNAGGCGSHLKHYRTAGRRSGLRDRAALVGRKAQGHPRMARRDRPARRPRRTRPPETVTYHESCHLCHGQKITAQPRQLLRAIPESEAGRIAGKHLVLRQRGHLQYHSAGNGRRTLDRKLHTLSTGAAVVATGNPGCLLQLVNGAKQKGLCLRIVHPVTLLAEAYRNA